MFFAGHRFSLSLWAVVVSHHRTRRPEDLVFAQLPYITQGERMVSCYHNSVFAPVIPFECSVCYRFYSASNCRCIVFTYIRFRVQLRGRQKDLLLILKLLFKIKNRRNMRKYYVLIIEHLAAVDVFLRLCNQMIHEASVCNQMQMFALGLGWLMRPAPLTHFFLSFTQLHKEATRRNKLVMKKCCRPGGLIEFDSSCFKDLLFHLLASWGLLTYRNAVAYGINMINYFLTLLPCAKNGN